MRVRGVEQSALAASRTPISEKRGTESGTLPANLAPSDHTQPDPDLAYLIDRWLGLPQETRTAILTLARSVAAAEKP